MSCVEPVMTTRARRAVELLKAADNGLTIAQLARSLKVKLYSIPKVITEARKIADIRKVQNGKTTEGSYYIPDAEEMDRFEKRNQPWA